jgi:hypothetical protein
MGVLVKQKYMLLTKSQESSRQNQTKETRPDHQRITIFHNFFPNSCKNRGKLNQMN